MDKLTAFLMCPISQRPLSIATKAELDSLNQRGLRNVDGTMAPHLEGALIVHDTPLIFPIVDGIPALLPELVLTDGNGGDWLRNGPIQLAHNKQVVLNFYEKFGWNPQSNGELGDALLFVDRRPVSARYLSNCHRRTGHFLPGKGVYLLDVASGALTHPEYLEYSENFSYRVCVDFSLEGLRQARKKLGEKGICILGGHYQASHQRGLDGRNRISSHHLSRAQG